ncbi:MAG: ATP:cob(I)alamin adenosyltransferase [Deltaproteobacteria bacterium RIFCSPHIGHO2_12_FULL_43_9]|nr:MAG: ATP:cob(I)alamin adenosyltransferase [Deltaproteobacteria bacterium RIFCSPHIGHO2_12_FULL_43_9]
MKIYTKKGDKGESGLFTGERIPKHSLFFHAYGNVDELAAILGLAVSCTTDKEIKDIIIEIQRDLFQIGSDLSTPVGNAEKEKKIDRVSPEQTIKLERIIDKFDSQLPELKNFILPGGTIPASYLHFARTVCRRAERYVSALTNEGKANKEVLIYLNRLSDLLFVLARVLNNRSNIKETIWKRS